MTQQVLNGTDIVACLNEMGCKTVTKGVAVACFSYPGPAKGLLNSLLDGGFMDMVASFNLADGINGASGGREDKLPGPGSGWRVYISAPRHRADAQYQNQP